MNLLLRPEIEELNDVTANVGESLTWEAIIKGNPKPDITWIKDGTVLEKGDRFDFEEDKRNNKFRLIIKSVEVEDKGIYQIAAKNYLGEASAEATLTAHSKFTDYFHGSIAKERLLITKFDFQPRLQYS